MFRETFYCTVDRTCCNRGLRIALQITVNKRALQRIRFIIIEDDVRRMRGYLMMLRVLTWPVLILRTNLLPEEFRKHFI
ncbi:hypothetical protein X992_5507 [Burkholderia pseudomallei MSHR5492]|nr:hypothetical protein X992_5507 [Burkholderia pseudomallei MSHR5492]